MNNRIIDIKSVKELTKKDQQFIKGGGFPFFDDCCACVFTPGGSPFPVLITQSCSLPCPIDGSFEDQDTGC